MFNNRHKTRRETDWLINGNMDEWTHDRWKNK